MPRDSNGVYSLPAGNPVVTLTPITSTWANSTLDDVATALTNSLDRAGSGGMTGPLKLSNGSSGAPALSWVTEPTSGLYRNAAGDFRYSISASDRLAVTAALFSVTTSQLAGPGGTALLPGYTFTTDPDTGLFSSGANQFDLVNGGVSTVSVTGAGLFNVVGSAANPSYSFMGDGDTGMYHGGANELDFSTNGINRYTIGVSAISSFLSHRFTDGLVGTPAITFESDLNTGIWRGASDQIDFSCGGVDTLVVGTAGLFNISGSAANPAYSFQGDGNLGIYRIGADNLGLSTAGVLRVNVDSAGTLFYTTASAAREVGFRGGELRVGSSLTLVQTDNGRVIRCDGTGVTVPALAEGTIITVINGTGGSITLTRSGITLFTSGTTTDSNKTVPVTGVVTLVWYSGTTNVVATGVFS